MLGGKRRLAGALSLGVSFIVAVAAVTPAVSNAATTGCGNREGDCVTGVDFSATEGHVVNVTPVAQFSTSPGDFCPDFSSGLTERATIDWGDGQRSAGGVLSNLNGGEVDGSHTYAEEGTYSVVVYVEWDCASSILDFATGTATASVADASLSASPVNFSQMVGMQYSGTVANFTDANASAPASDFTATINWGDGTYTTAGIVGSAGNGAGSFTVSGSHTYHDPGQYVVRVVIQDDGGSGASVNSTANVTLTPQLTLPTLCTTHGCL